MPDLAIDKSQAQRFLDNLDPNGGFTFQTFDDNQDRRDKSLTRTFHGTLERNFEALSELNRRGAGVFVTVNETDGTGRRAENITRVRAAFVDLDGAPLTPVLEEDLEPTIVVESSAGRWHAYYRCEGLALADFKTLQAALASKFEGDRAVKDLPRVMRLPGFFHQKVKKGERSAAFMTRIESSYDDAPHYTGEELLGHFCTASAGPDDLNDECVQIPLTEGRERLTEALSFIDPTDRDVWVKVGHALKSENPDLLADFLSWSRGDLQGQRPSTFISDGDVISNWNSFRPERIGLGAVYTLAAQYGFQPTGPRSRLRLGTQVEVARLIRMDIEQESGVDIVFDEGAFWRFTSTHWVEETRNELRKRVHGFDGTPLGKKGHLKLSKTFIDGVLVELAAMTAYPGFFDERPAGVNLRNGFAHLGRVGEVSVEPHAPDHRQRFILEHEYRRGCAELPDGLFKTLLYGSLGTENVEMHQLILEVVGAAITGVNTQLKAPKGFVLFGASAANGKSALQALIRALLPSSAISSVPPADLGEPQFLATLAGRQVNLSDEISSSRAISSDRFKAVITGDPVSAKVVYREPFTFTPRALHVFAANQLPSFSGGVDNGVERRLVIVPFDRTIPERERIPDLGEMIVRKEGDVVVSLAIDAAAELLKRGQYAIPKNCEAATSQWFRDADPVKEWLEDGGLERHVSTAGILLNGLYVAFREDVGDLGITHIPSRRRFLQRIRDAIGQDPQWREVKRAKGQMIFPNDLLSPVTLVTQKTENSRN